MKKENATACEHKDNTSVGCVYVKKQQQQKNSLGKIWPVAYPMRLGSVVSLSDVVSKQKQFRRESSGAKL